MKNVCKFLILSAIASVGSIVAGGEGSSKNPFSSPDFKHTMLIYLTATLDLNNPDQVQQFKNSFNTNTAWDTVCVPFQKCPELELRRRGLKAGSLEQSEKMYHFDNCLGVRYQELTDDQLLRFKQIQDKLQLQSKQ